MKLLIPILLLGVSSLINAGNTYDSIAQLRENRIHNPAMTSIPHMRIARELKRLTQPGDLVVVNEVGAIGYYSGLHVVDLLGLTNRDIARRRHSNAKAYGEYIVSLRPKYIMLNNKQRPWDAERHIAHQAIYDAMVASGQYREDRSFDLNYYKKLTLYVRQ